MVLLLETAEVLEARARRCPDPAQAAVLLRRAQQRRQQAARLREGPAGARGGGSAAHRPGADGVGRGPGRPVIR